MLSGSEASLDRLKEILHFVRDDSFHRAIAVNFSLLILNFSLEF